MFGLYLFGILVAVLTGLFLRSTPLPGKSDSMVMEMPDYEWPRPVDVGLRTWQKLKSFHLRRGQNHSTGGGGAERAQFARYRRQLRQPGSGRLGAEQAGASP